MLLKCESGRKAPGVTVRLPPLASGPPFFSAALLAKSRFSTPLALTDRARLG
jgi:hypothetical protein